MMHRHEAAFFLRPVKEREVGDPKQVVLVVINKVETLAKFKTQCAECRINHGVLGVRNDEDAVTGLCAALLNTALFMTALVVLFGNTEYLQGLIGGRNVIVFICAFVGINAVVEMLAATFAVGLVGTALHKAKLIK